MSDLDKTMKIRAYSHDAKKEATQNNLNEDQRIALELSKITAQLEEEQAKAREFGEVIQLLRRSLKDEQTKTVELARKVGEFEAEIKRLEEVLGKISTVVAEAIGKKAS